MVLSRSTTRCFSRWLQRKGTVVRYYSQSTTPDPRKQLLEHALSQNKSAVNPAMLQRMKGLNSKKAEDQPPTLLIFTCAVIGIPPLIYYYYQYRRAQEDAKKAKYLAEHNTDSI